MASFRVRRATVRDLPMLVRQRRGMWGDRGPWSKAELDAADRVYHRWAAPRLRSGTLVGFLAEAHRNRTVGSGCVWLQEVQPRPGFAGGVQPYLMSMYTERDFRRRGVASAIVRAAVRWVRAGHHPRFTLHASQMGRHVYRRLGFERTWEMRREFPLRRR